MKIIHALFALVLLESSSAFAPASYQAGDRSNLLGVLVRNLNDNKKPSSPSLYAAVDPSQQREEASSSAASSAASESSNTVPRPSLRRIQRVEKFARLPVWPAWNGALIFIISRIFGMEAAAKLEHAIGGRVCPNFFDSSGITSPFIMLVHHRHVFWKLDPLRHFQKALILPEGFPAHPHRGFTTVTYFLKGGFRHRDSMGVSQTYGAKQDKYPHHTQWLFTGAGLLHEEMFDVPASSWSSDQELYQLWLNVPSHYKLDAPQSFLLGDDEAPRIISENNKSETVVIAGSYQGQSSKAPSTMTPNVDIFHVTVQPGATWSHTLNKSQQTCIIYIRTGSLSIDGTEVPVHHTAYLEPVGDVLEIKAAADGVDFMLLAGAPLNEPIAAQGSMVMNSPEQINQAYADYQRGYMGLPWDHKLSNEEWQAQLRQAPGRYTYQNEVSEE
jgi:redox-sensitive bicupin YhaK (pirin superfamily)